MSERSILKKINPIFEWKDYVEEHYPVKYATNGEVRICCPACGESDFKCYVNVKHGVFNCFKCDFKTGKKYNLFDFVSITEGIPRGSALVRLVQEYKPITPDHVEIPEEEQREFVHFLDTVRVISGFPEGVKLLTENEGERQWKYLMDRGLTKEEILKYQTHYVPDDYLVLTLENKPIGDIGQRVVWPIYGGRHDLVSWIARTTDPNYGGKDKYINCPRTDMAKTFWPYVPPYEKEVVLVEGIMDCMAVRRLPKTSAYACFGKHLSFTQTMILKSWGVESVTLFFDKDVPKKDIIKLVNELKNVFKDVYVLWQRELNKDLDAGDCLKLENGTAIIESVLKNRVHHDSMEYVSWQIEY